MDAERHAYHRHRICDGFDLYRDALVDAYLSGQLNMDRAQFSQLMAVMWDIRVRAGVEFQDEIKKRTTNPEINPTGDRK